MFTHIYGNVDDSIPIIANTVTTFIVSLICMYPTLHLATLLDYVVLFGLLIVWTPRKN